MNLRRDIEKLIYWYVPAVIISYFLGTAVAAQVKHINGVTPLLSWGLVVTSILTKHIDNIVIAIWLYFLAKRMNQRYVLWTLFGLAAHLFAVVLFIALHIYEKANPDEVEQTETTKPKRKLFIWSK
jgi:hypothetical protein